MQQPPDALPPCADGAVDRATNTTTHQEAGPIVPQMPLLVLLERMQEALPPPGVAFTLPLSRGLLEAAIERVKQSGQNEQQKGS